MAKKNKDENPVSLFAFQDIITSITGIMVLVVLLIILDIIDHEESKSRDNASPFAEDVKKLEQMAKGLEEQLEEGKDWMTRNEELILKALSTDLSALPKLIEREKKQHLMLTAGLQNLKEESVRLESLVLKTKEENDAKQGKINKGEEDVAAMLAHTEDNAATIASLEDKIKKLEEDKEKMKNRVEIKTSKDIGLEPIFVECSESMIKVKVIKTSQIKEFADTDTDQMLRQFYGWLKSSANSRGQYIVLIVKPSSAKFAEIMMGLLKHENFSYNMEPIEENKTGVYE
ncbi:MAG: hypothetical protein JW808_02325 [Victivallales bacterium]|nr:hypothetical protein [Victivallales bacterium]